MRNFLKNKEGNIAITFGIALMPIALSVGAAVDYSNSARVQSKISNSADAALLSAASKAIEDVDLTNKKAVETTLRSNFKPFFIANVKANKRYSFKDYSVNYDPKTHLAKAKVEFEYKTYVLGIMGKPVLKVSAVSETKIQVEAGGAISMYLVLDKSGSMGWYGKMTALKAAVHNMAKQFETADPDQKYVRMGAVAYDSRTQRSQRIVWGSRYADYYVQRLWAYGGTNSVNAIRRADQELSNRREVLEHKKKNQQDPTKIIVFMTDGSNNRYSWDRKTINNCNRAKSHNIEIYSVAFQAPSRGQRLLRACASDGSHYFDARNATDLIGAFKKIGATVGQKLILTQ